MDAYSKRVMDAMLCMTRQCWEQGMAAQAFLETGCEKELKLAVHDMIARQSADGRLCNVENTPAVTDSAFCIPAVWAMARYGIPIRASRKTCPSGGRAGFPARYGMDGEICRKAVADNIQFLLEEAEHAEDKTLFHMKGTKEIWADSAAFLPYALAVTGHKEEAFCQMEGICKRLYDKESRLYFHMWDEGKREYIRPLAWGVGNGWILSGLLRLILLWREEPECQREKKQLEKRFYELLNQMLALETAQGGFHDILNQPDSFEESETAAMVSYVLYRGIKEKLLKTGYLKIADRIRAGIHEKTTAEGLVMDAAGSPDFARPGTSVECQAHVILMEKYQYDVRNS